jgi:hypothetical protein
MISCNGCWVLLIIYAQVHQLTMMRTLAMTRYWEMANLAFRMRPGRRVDQIGCVWESHLPSCGNRRPPALYLCLVMRVAVNPTAAGH